MRHQNLFHFIFSVKNKIIPYDVIDVVKKKEKILIRSATFLVFIQRKADINKNMMGFWKLKTIFFIKQFKNGKMKTLKNN